MTDYDINAQERTAREIYHDASFLGIDGEEAVHYWSIYNQSVVVIEADGEVSTFPLSETPCRNLSDWMAHTDRKRGWETHRVASSTADMIRNAVC